MKKPNYELLKQAYAIIDGIPEKAFDLELVIKKGGNKRELKCGTIACAAGWLSLHPTFMKENGLEAVRKRKNGFSYVTWKNKTDQIWDYTIAMAEFFNLSFEKTNNLFCPSNESDVISDKQVWKTRVEKYLRSEGQL